MHGDFCVRVASEGRLYECRVGVSETVKLIKSACALMWHLRRVASAASSLAMLIIGFVFVEPSKGAIVTNWNTSILTCTADSKAMTFMANDKWQEVTVNATDQNFSGQCVVKVNFTSSSASSLANVVREQPAVLVKVFKLQILPVGSPCASRSMSLDIQFIAQPVSINLTCTEHSDDALYIWVSKPVQLYLYVLPNAYTRTSFSVAFSVVQSVNICYQASINRELAIAEVDLYVFAPDYKFSEMMPLSDSCNGSKQILVTAANSLSSLTMTVLAAPMTTSCWSLLLNDVQVGVFRSQSFAAGANVSLLYKRTRYCFVSDRRRGFTIKWSAAPTLTGAWTLTTAAPGTSVNLSARNYFVSVSSTSIAAVPTVYANLLGGTDLKSTSVLPAAVGSTVAALVVMAAILVIALLVIRGRRIMQRRDSLYDSRHSPMTSVLNLADTDVVLPINYEQPEPPHEPSLHPQSLPLNVFSISSHAARNIDVGHMDVVMTDNDLYDSNCGS